MKRIVLPAIFISIVFLLLVLLGFWQLDRAQQKQQLVEALAIKQSAPIVQLHSLEDITYTLHQRVILEGKYLSTHFIYDNQIHNGVYGYYVISPFVLSKSHETILINRGFQAWDALRTLPDIATPKVRSITATVSNISRRPTLEQHNKEATTSFPLVVQSLDAEYFGTLLNTMISESLLLLESNVQDGYIREWQPYYGLSVDKHYGYALQWFAMATILLLISVRLLMRYTHTFSRK